MAGELASLNSNQRRRVSEAIYRAVKKSFEQDQERIGRPRSIRVTQHEVKRRGEICLRIFGQLRCDLGWGLQRAIDHLPEYLRSELDGIDWVPDQRKMWVPGDGA